jgi:type II secretory pathway pseudopilin PulG
MPTLRKCTARRRRAFTFVEILAAVTMLSVLLGLMGQIMAQSKRQAAAAERSAKALVFLENAMELATSLSWDEVDDELITRLPIANDLSQRWPGAELTCQVADSSDPLSSKQITLTLRTSAESPRPATLTTWIYRTPGVSEEEER